MPAAEVRLDFVNEGKLFDAFPIKVMEYDGVNSGSSLGGHRKTGFRNPLDGFGIISSYSVVSYPTPSHPNSTHSYPIPYHQLLGSGTATVLLCEVPVKGHFWSHFCPKLWVQISAWYDPEAMSLLLKII